MIRFFTFGLLLILVSCGQKTDNNKINQAKDSLTSKIEVKNESKSSAEEIRKHETFNKNIDSIPEDLKSFIPANYSAIRISSGDANFDGLTDKILVLRKDTEETTSNYNEDKPDKRPLLLLLGQPDNSYTLIFRNDNAVYCIDCGGVFGDPFTGVTIKNGYFSIEHGIAGGQHWEQVTTFKYDRLKNNWFLYKDHYISYKLNESDASDAEALVIDVDKMQTSKDFGIISFDKFNIYNEDGN
ncbi:hypothetical protein [Flavobacterium branchiicola]|uniref:Lipoprotein n=1 Tax=Flavobacterium branchiicola TaxID=1114875 RepID=A0ABV9PKB8_9FLAO|nr:hypothetical protein [Flavobacterium branchiicola]MBS7256362.1 hypothetical protein [Flavobacterium branchiicola]